MTSNDLYTNGAGLELTTPASTPITAEEAAEAILKFAAANGVIGTGEAVSTEVDTDDEGEPVEKVSKF